MADTICCMWLQCSKSDAHLKFKIIIPSHQGPRSHYPRGITNTVAHAQVKYLFLLVTPDHEPCGKVPPGRLLFRAHAT